MEKPGRPDRAVDAPPPAPDSRLSFDTAAAPPPQPGTRLSLDADGGPMATPARAGKLELAGRRIPPGALVAALAVAAAGAVAATQLGGGDTSESSSPPAKPAQTPGAAPAPAMPPAASEPTQDDVRTLLRSYTQSYGAEDVDGLRELFAADALRISEGEKQSREEAMATYRDQFAELTGPTYRLDGLQIQTRPGGATATGRYAISSRSSSTTATGDIVFRLENRDGRLVIEQLTIEPD
jgi:hypothetical protein